MRESRVTETECKRFCDRFQASRNPAAGTSEDQRVLSGLKEHRQFSHPITVNIANPRDTINPDASIALGREKPDALFGNVDIADQPTGGELTAGEATVFVGFDFFPRRESGSTRRFCLIGDGKLQVAFEPRRFEWVFRKRDASAAAKATLGGSGVTRLDDDFIFRGRGSLSRQRRRNRKQTNQQGEDASRRKQKHSRLRMSPGLSEHD